VPAAPQPSSSQKLHSSHCRRTPRSQSQTRARGWAPAGRAGQGGPNQPLRGQAHPPPLRRRSSPQPPPARSPAVGSVPVCQ